MLGLLEQSVVLCKQGVAGSIPATSTNPFDYKGFTKLFPHPILAAVHKVCKIALIVATVHNHSETTIAENTERRCTLELLEMEDRCLKSRCVRLAKNFKNFKHCNLPAVSDSRGLGRSI
jgi:hypothetical protein